MNILDAIDKFVEEIENDVYIGAKAEMLGSKVSEIVAHIIFIEDSSLKAKAMKELPRIKEAFAKKGMKREEFATEMLLNDLVFNKYSPINSKLKDMLKNILEISEEDENLDDIVKEVIKRTKVIDVSVKNFNDAIVFTIGNKNILTYEEIEMIIKEVSRNINVNIDLNNIITIYGTEKIATLEIADMPKKIVLEFKNVEMTTAELGYYLDGFKQYIEK